MKLYKDVGVESVIEMEACFTSMIKILHPTSNYLDLTENNVVLHKHNR
jgi:hypothetical protein